MIGNGASRGHDPRMLRTAVLACPFLIAAALGAQAGTVAAAPAVHGRVERHDGLQVLRVWGSPEQRGHAHGLLLAADFAAVALPEFTARFARKPQLLVQARAALGRLIEYPDDVQAELQGLWRGLVESKVALRLHELDRDFDHTDLLVANALDVFGLMGCSGFTVWGEQAVGGGVLTARNFDWPYTGEHTQQHTMVVVHHFDDGRAVAAVTWPGYVGAVTGVSSDGVAAFLHVGTGKITWSPEPSSWPSAIAVRAILAHGAGEPAALFAHAKEVLGNTSPPAGYLTHLVLPRVPAGGTPVGLFETDAGSCVGGASDAKPFVLTNHFRTRTDGRGASKDSKDREQQLDAGLDTCFDLGDRRVSPEEAWELLAKVQRGGNRGFGTLHALVFRHEPWCFELRVATPGELGIVAAPVSARRHVLTREQLFAVGQTFGGAPK